MNPPVLTAPIQGKPFILYMAAQEQSVGALLAQENKEDRLARWYLQLQQFEIIYVPQKAVKGQVLADFSADHPFPAEWECVMTSPMKMS
ncbi:hypothetical protein LIER_16788 [Lithospermum erythrorhizon]|uniref:Reverse transcriptase RNase H-like domain-containing protein n=1 Tax=Lithospermum erythrorhizon TaxID=34254 RepID=A0AAV3QC49_LITER